MTFTDNFDFDDYMNDKLDMALVADNHLFANGKDLLGYAPGDHLAPGSSLVGQTFDFPQDTTGLCTEGINGEPYINHTVSNPSAEPEGVGRSIIIDTVDPEIWNIDPELLNAGTDFILTPNTVPATSEFNPAVVLYDSYFYPGVAADLHQNAQTMEQQQQGWETSVIESMQPFFELQSELQPDALIEERLTNQAQIELSSYPTSIPPTETQPTPQSKQHSLEAESSLDSQQVHGPQAQGNVISGAATQLLQTAEPVDSQLLHQPTRTDSPIEDGPSPEVPLPRKSRTKHNTHRTRTPAKHDSGLTVSEDAIPGLSFSSLHDAEIAMASRYMKHDWESPTPDDSIPITNDERSRYILNMLTAFQDTSTCKDSKNGYSFVKRWLTADYYDVQDIEKVCWHILSVAERLHSEGPSALNIFCAEAQRKVYVSRNLTFKERIEAICDCLKYTKSMCDNLMKAEGIETLVGSPKLKMNAARTMVPQNAKRQQWMTQGRNEDPTHVSTRTGRDSVAVRAFVEVEEAAPLKRKRKTKQPKQPKGAAKSQPQPIASAQIGTSLDTPSRPTAPAKGYAPAQTRAPPQTTVPPQSNVSVNESSELLRQLSAGLQPSSEKLPTTPAPAPLPSGLSQPSEPSKPVRSNPAPLPTHLSQPSKPLELVRSNPAPVLDASIEDAPAQSPASEPSQPVRKPRVKVRKQLQALLADAEHSKAVSDAHSLLQTKRATKAVTKPATETTTNTATKATTDNALKTKEYLKSVYDESNSESESEEPARPTKRQRKTGESASSKKPESDIARRQRQRKAKTNSKLWNLLISLASDLESDVSSDDDTPVIKHKPIPVVKPATRFPPPSVKPKASAASKSTAPMSKKRMAVPDADSEVEAEAPRRAKRTKTSTTDDARKFASAKPAPVNKGKAMRKIPATEDSDDSEDDFVPDSDDDSDSDS